MRGNPRCLKWVTVLGLPLASVGWAQPVVTNIRADSVSHSSLRLIWDSSSTINKIRIRYGFTTAYENGPGGGIFVPGTGTLSQYGQAASLSGLAPGSTYHFCPQSSSDNGQTWSSCTDFTVKTEDLPAQHPAPPALPQTFNTSYPVQTGAQRLVAENCSDLQEAINSANYGDTILIPAGTVCTGAYTLPVPREAKRFTADDVDTQAGTIRIPGHGFQDGQRVRFGSYGRLPGSAIYPPGLNWNFAGVKWGTDYYVRVVDPDRFRLATRSDGPAIDFSIAHLTVDAQTSQFTVSALSEIPRQGLAVHVRSAQALPGGLQSNRTYYVVTPTLGNSVSNLTVTGEQASVITGAPHGLKEGAKIRLRAPSHPALNGIFTVESVSSGVGFAFRAPSSVPSGTTVTSGIQYDSLTFQLSASAGGPPISLTSPGSGQISLADPGQGTSFVLAWPPEDRWIVVRTATPDEEFCPEGVRCYGAIWRSRMATLHPPGPGMGPSLLTLSALPLAHNWRFTGLEFTHPDRSADAQSTIDPTPFYGFIGTYPSNANIIFDRCYIHGLGAPNRIYRAIYQFDGENMALIDSDLEKLDFWHPYASGMRVTVSNPNELQIAPGAYNLGARTVTTTSPVSIRLSGGTSSGDAVLYLDMSGLLNVVLPPGVTGSCTGPLSCRISNQSDPKLPRDSGGRLTGAPLAKVSVSNGQWGTASPLYAPSLYATEGAPSFIAGNGPGPFLIRNNRISGSGIPMHFDDSGAGIFIGHDYTVRRNLFTLPLSQHPRSPLSDGRWYGHRNHLEWKSGYRILVDGNIFENNIADVTPLGNPLVLTARSGGEIRDVTITNNTFRANAGGITVAPVDSYNPVSPPITRILIRNNLFHDTDGNQFAVTGRGYGWALQLGYALEDVVVDHNTVYDNRGRYPVFWHITQQPIEGVAVTNNILWVNDETGAYGFGAESVSQNQPACRGSGRELLDCVFTSGAGNPSYEFRANVLIPGWLDTLGPSRPMDPTMLSSRYSGLGAYIPDGRDITARQAQVGFEAPEQRNFRLKPESPYAAGQALAAPDGTALGADIDALELAQGRIPWIFVDEIQPDSASIYFPAPEISKPCWVLYGEGSDIAAFARTSANTQPDYLRKIQLTGLAPERQYRVRVLCRDASEQPEAVFRTAPAP